MVFWSGTLVDAHAYIPGQGYIRCDGVDAAEVVSAFAQKAEELRDRDGRFRETLQVIPIDSNGHCCFDTALQHDDSAFDRLKSRGWSNPR